MSKTFLTEDDSHPYANDRPMKTVDATRMVLLGSRHCAGQVLHLLDESSCTEVVGVVASPEPIGTWSYLQTTAEILSIPVLSLDDAVAMNPDWMLSVNYERIIPADIVKRFRIVNAHSLLPRFKGRNAVVHAILNARRDGFWAFGCSLHEMTEEVDGGPIIVTKVFPITEQHTAQTLYLDWEACCLSVIEENLQRLATGSYIKAPNEGGTYYSRELDKRVNLQWEPTYLMDAIRAYTFPPYPGPYAMVDWRKVWLTLEDSET